MRYAVYKSDDIKIFINYRGISHYLLNVQTKFRILTVY